MGQPGCNDVTPCGDSYGSSSTYYFRCYNCEAVTGGKNDIDVSNCKHKGKFREFSANGGRCNGYDPGFVDPDITIDQAIIRKYITLVDHIFDCSYFTSYSIEEFDSNMHGVWSGPDKRAALKLNKLTVEKDGNICLRLKNGSPYYRTKLTWG